MSSTNLENSKEQASKDVEETEETPLKRAMASMLAVIILSLIISVVYLTFDWIAFCGSVVLIALVLGLNPTIPKTLIKETQVLYYCVFFGITLLFSIERCKNDINMVCLVIVGILTTLLTFYVQSRMLVGLSMWLHIYVVLSILVMYWKKSRCNQSL